MGDVLRASLPTVDRKPVIERLSRLVLIGIQEFPSEPGKGQSYRSASHSLEDYRKETPFVRNCSPCA